MTGPGHHCRVPTNRGSLGACSARPWPFALANLPARLAAAQSCNLSWRAYSCGSKLLRIATDSKNAGGYTVVMRGGVTSAFRKFKEGARQFNARTVFFFFFANLRTPPPESRTYTHHCAAKACPAGERVSNAASHGRYDGIVSVQFPTLSRQSLPLCCQRELHH